MLYIGLFERRERERAESREQRAEGRKKERQPDIAIPRDFGGSLSLSLSLSVLLSLSRLHSPLLYSTLLSVL